MPAVQLPFANASSSYHRFVNYSSHIDQLLDPKNDSKQRMILALNAWKKFRNEHTADSNDEVLLAWLKIHWTSLYGEGKLTDELLDEVLPPLHKSASIDSQPCVEPVAEEVAIENKRIVEPPPDESASPSTATTDATFEGEEEGEEEEEEEGEKKPERAFRYRNTKGKTHRFGFRATTRPIAGIQFAYDTETGNHEEFDDAYCITQNSRFWQDHRGDSKNVRMLDIYLGHEAGNVIVLDGADLILQQGRRYGLIGRNGVGKTTLLRAIATRRMKDFPMHIVTMFVDQDLVGSDENAMQCVLHGHRRLMKLRAEEQKLTQQKNANQERLSTVYAELEMLRSETAELRIREILQGLQFTEAMMTEPTKKLSGGWRMRVALAQALFLEPHILLLDEPTNHLDLPATIWLQDFLVEAEFCVLLVSHDKAFLNAVSTDIIVMKKQKLKYYQGDYETYEKVKRDSYMKQLHQFENHQRNVEHIQQTIANCRKQGKTDEKKLGTVASRKKKLERGGMEKHEDGKRWKKYSGDGYRAEITAPEKEEGVKFKFPVPAELLYRGTLMQMEDVSFRYTPNSPEIIRHFNLSIEGQSRIGIVGENGCGKSTLLNLLIGELTPDSGEVKRHHNVSIGYFSQHHVDQLDMKTNPIQHLMAKGISESEARGKLGAFGLDGRCMLSEIGNLSGGQKSRVLFAAVTVAHPQVLILDEPTNHLDMDTITALIQALKDYTGSVILVSHDRQLMMEIPNEFYWVRKGNVKKLAGGMEEYVAAIRARNRASASN